jgi:hypothetical protein
MPISNPRRIPFSVLAVLAAAFAFAIPAAVATAAPSAGAAQVEEEGPEEEFEEDELSAEEEEFFAEEEEFFAEEEEADVLPEEVAAIQRATGDLGRAKRAVAAKVARLSSSTEVLRSCLRGGPGWKRIRSIDHAPQRALYTAAARKLLADMKLLLDGQQPRIVVFEPLFKRFVADLRAAPVSDPTLREAVAAQARRLAAYHDLRKVKANCQVFNKLAKRVREFPTRSAEQIVRADYRATPIARKIERNVSDQLEKIDRRHGISYRDAEILADAAKVMVDLGGEPGYATGFQYALSLR